MKLLLAMLPTVLLTAYSQLMVKWRLSGIAATVDVPSSLVARFTRYLLDPYVFSAYACSLFSAIAWLYVAERYPVSVAFPAYVGILFAVVTIGGVLLLNEALSVRQVLGLALILSGVVFVSRMA